MKYKLIIAVLLTILLSWLILLISCRVQKHDKNITIISIAGKTYLIQDRDTTRITPRYWK